MGANYSHTTRGNITLTPEIYNADHQNHIDNSTPPMIDDYSTSVAQMQAVTSPGAVNTESLATTLAGELERLRFMIKSITGKPQWYAPPDAVLGAPFASGTRLPFAQPAAPTGWTRDLSDNANNRLFRAVSAAPDGAGGAVGGNQNPILNDVVPVHFHLFTTSTESNFHSHTTNDPGHSHLYTLRNAASGTAPNASGGSDLGFAAASTSGNTTGVTVNNNSTLHTHSGSTDNGSSQTSWAPRYLNFIVCTKD